MPLAEIQALLAAEGDAAQKRLAGHRRRLEAQLADAQYALTLLDALCRMDGPEDHAMTEDRTDAQRAANAGMTGRAALHLRLLWEGGDASGADYRRAQRVHLQRVRATGERHHRQGAPAAPGHRRMRGPRTVTLL